MKNKPLSAWIIAGTLALVVPSPVRCGDDAPQPAPTARVSLWPDRAPVGDGKFETITLELKVFLPSPDKATGAAVVICPGGGYIRTTAANSSPR